MSANSSTNDGDLIIDPAVLADIQRQCRERAAELEAARGTAAPGIALPAPATQATTSDVSLGSEEQAQHLAAAIDQMPPRIRAFFEPEDAVPPWRWESSESRVECERLADLGGWAGG